MLKMSSPVEQFSPQPFLFAFLLFCFFFLIFRGCCSSFPPVPRPLLHPQVEIVGEEVNGVKDGDGKTGASPSALPWKGGRGCVLAGEWGKAKKMLSREVWRC